MARVKGHVFTQSDFPCGRLVAVKAEYDSAEKILEFLIPSISRGERVYGVELDLRRLEVACGCEAFSDYREASRMPYNRKTAGVYTEHFARTRKKPVYLLPLITRPLKALCPHARKVRQWCQRNGLMPYLKAREARMLEILEEEDQKVSA